MSYPVFKRVYTTSNDPDPNWVHKQPYGQPPQNDQAAEWFEKWQAHLLRNMVGRIIKGKSTQNVHSLSMAYGTLQIANRPPRQLRQETMDVYGVSVDVSETPDYQTSLYDTMRLPGTVFECPCCGQSFEGMSQDDIRRHHKKRHEQPTHPGEERTFWLKHTFKKIIVVYRDSGDGRGTLEERLVTIRRMLLNLHRTFLVPFPAEEARVAVIAEHVRSIDVPTFHHRPSVENAFAKKTFIFRNFTQHSTRDGQELYANNADLMTRSILAELRICWEAKQNPLLVCYGIDGFSCNWGRMVEWFREFCLSCKELSIILASGSFDSDSNALIRKACYIESGGHFFGRYYASHIVDEADGKPIENKVYAEGIRAWKAMCAVKYESNVNQARNSLSMTGNLGRNR